MKEIKELEKYWNFQTIIAKLEEEKEKSSDPEDIYAINDKLVLYRHYYNQLQNLNFGEAYFPVINAMNLNLSGLRIIKVSNSGGKVQYGLASSWNNVKKFVANFLNDYLYKEIKNIMFFNWGFDDYSVEIKDLNDKIEKIDETKGDSLELAMAVALISLVMQHRVKPIYAFTGRVIYENNIHMIGNVNHIQQKSNILQREYYFLKNLIVPIKTDNDNFQIEFGKFDDLIKFLFPDFKNIILKLLAEENFDNFGKRKVYANLEKIKTLEGIECNLLKINQTNILFDDWEKYAKFLSNLERKIWKDRLPVIVDGKIISFVVPILTAKSINHVVDFIAVRNVNGDSHNTTNACIVETAKLNSKYKIGQRIQYKIEQ